MKKEVIKIEVRKSRIPYTLEEKEKLFNDGHIRMMSNIQFNKKRYKRKIKHKHSKQDY